MHARLGDPGQGTVPEKEGRGDPARQGTFFFFFSPNKKRKKKKKKKTHSLFFLFLSLSLQPPHLHLHHLYQNHQASVFIAGVSPQASDLAFWGDVHGLDLSACAREARAHRARHGAVVAVEERHVVTSRARVHELDLLACRVGDEAFSTAFELQVLMPSSSSSSSSSPSPGAETATTETVAKKKGLLLGGVALWFDVEFSGRACPDAPVVLSTSPSAPQTHWHQALLELPSPMELACSSEEEEKEGGKEGESGRGAAAAAGVSTVRGRVSLSRGPCHRSVDVALEVQGFDSKGGAVPGTRHVGLYPFAMSD